MKNKMKENEWVPSVPGIAVELSFTALQSEEWKSIFQNNASPIKSVFSGNLDCNLQYEGDSNWKLNSEKIGKFKSMNKIKSPENVFVVNRNFRKKWAQQEINLIWDEELEQENEEPNHFAIFGYDMIQNDSDKFGLISDISNFEHKQRSDEKSDLKEEFDDFIRLGSKFDCISDNELENELEVFNYQQKFVNNWSKRSSKVQESSK